MQILSAPGALVRDPVTKRVVSTTEPLEVDPADVHWARLLADGDLIAAPDPVEPDRAAPADLDQEDAQ